MSECECQVAGFCQRFNRVQGEHHWQICQGLVLTPEKCGVYRSNWASLAKNPTRSAALAKDGPGTELKKLLAELGIKSFAGCSCEKHAAQMNAWGIDGCRGHFEEIREWVVDAQAKAGWLTTITAATNAAASGLALQLDPLDIPGSLVKLAIDRAEALHSGTRQLEAP